MAHNEDAFRLERLPDFTPQLFKRSWCSIPHPTLPLIATAHGKDVTVFSLSSLAKHSALTGGHSRSVRTATWKPGLAPGRLCLVTGSFDSTAALWRWDGDVPFDPPDATGNGTADHHGAEAEVMEVEIRRDGATRGGGLRSATTTTSFAGGRPDGSDSGDGDKDDDDWALELVLEGHESEIKSVAFSPSGQYLATCSRDKSVWIWEDVGASEADDEWETVAVLSEHDADVKAVAWCPDVPGRAAASRGRYSADVLASASYDNTVRIWREDGDGEWVCVAVLEGHEGTVWDLQWEPTTTSTRFPRLLSVSADATVRIWSLRDDEDEEEDGDGQRGGGDNAGLHRGGLGGIPNTMRRSMRENWTCTAVLPKVHTRDIYSASWSPLTGRIATTGGDGMIVIYEELTGQPGSVQGNEPRDLNGPTQPEPQVEAEGDAERAVGEVNGHTDVQPSGAANDTTPAPHSWRVLTKHANAHGPYEVNHITWCARFDRGAERKEGDDEMLVTTGDDGLVRPWKLVGS